MQPPDSSSRTVATQSGPPRRARVTSYSYLSRVRSDLARSVSLPGCSIVHTGLREMIRLAPSLLRVQLLAQFSFALLSLRAFLVPGVSRELPINQEAVFCQETFSALSRNFLHC